MKVPKKVLQALVSGYGDTDTSGYEVVVNDISDHSRWAVGYRLVFKWCGKFYETFYRVGATESQDERPFECDSAEVECAEVFPREVIQVVYLKEPA